MTMGPEMVKLPLLVCVSCWLLSRIAADFIAADDVLGMVEDYLKNDAFVHDKGHIKEHINNADLDIESANDKDLEFYFFQVHDVNFDYKLDGLELLHALNHNSEEMREDEKTRAANEKRTPRLPDLNPNQHFDYLTSLVDKMLNEDDFDKDGYISYAEFSSARISKHLL